MCHWLVVPFLVAGAAFAQQSIVSIRIYTDPPGASFWVDGERYLGAAAFLWPEFSKHLLYADPTFRSDNALYTFTEWRDGRDQRLQDGSRVSITATRDVPSYRAAWKLSYAIRLDFYDGAANLPFACLPGPEWGKLYINGSCYAANSEIWLEAGITVAVQAHAPAGWVFRGWHQAVYGSQAATLSFVLDRPVILAPIFELAARVALETSPPGLQLLADRTPVTTPITMDWIGGSAHAAGAISPQRDGQGAPWVFDSWSNAGAQYQTYTAGPAASLATLTARYAPAVMFGFVTNPPGLQLSIDGRTNWPGYNFLWAAGSRHTVSAPPEQADARGRRYVFRRWAHGGDATQELVVRETGGWTAHYEQLGRLVVRTRPEDITLTVDGSACASPCTIDRLVGSEVLLAVPPTAVVRDGTRLEFDGWSDGAAAERSFKIAAEASLAANYRLSYHLETSAEPPGSAALRLAPESADGYYPQGASVLVVAEPGAGYRFLHWEGDLGGPLRSGLVRMDRPRLARAVLERLPPVTPVQVRNAAGDTPEEGVAPGSIISIYGADLAATSEAGPRSPLAQTLAGVAVRAGDRLLPLLFVSPDRINAQLPAGVPEGEQELVVLGENRAQQTARFRAVRNAPGLFTDDLGFALAQHEDGTAVTAEAPVRGGEVVSLFGTGFGPFERILPDGFPAPVPALLVDPVEVVVAGQRLEPLFSGAAGEPGVVVVRFRLPDELPGGAIELLATANGKQSNVVRLNSETRTP